MVVNKLEIVSHYIFFYNIKTDIVKNKNSPYNSTFFIALLSQ